LTPGAGDRLPMLVTPGEGGVLRSIGQEVPQEEYREFLRVQYGPPHGQGWKVPRRTLRILPIVVDGREVPVVFSSDDMLTVLEKLAQRFGLPDGAEVRPLGLAFVLQPGRGEYHHELGTLLYFQESHETIDFCLRGNLRDEGGRLCFVLGQRDGATSLAASPMEGPFFKRQVTPFAWEAWETYDAFYRAEVEARRIYETTVQDIRTRRSHFFVENFGEYDAMRYHSFVHSPPDATGFTAAAGTLWASNKDEVAVIVETRGTAFGNGVVEMLFPDGRRRQVDLAVERWSPMPAWDTIGRVVVLNRGLEPIDQGALQRFDDKAFLRGEGHFPGGGRHPNPWIYPVRISRYEYACRLAAALGWAAPAAQALDLDGQMMAEPGLQTGEWVLVPARGGLRPALVCNVTDLHQTSSYGGDHWPEPHAFLRDEAGHLYNLTVSEVLAVNPRPPHPVFLAGPVLQGIPESPVLTWQPSRPATPQKSISEGDKA